MNIMDKIKDEIKEELTSEVAEPLKVKLTQLIKLKKVLRIIQKDIKVLVEEAELDSKEIEKITSNFVDIKEEK